MVTFLKLILKYIISILAFMGSGICLGLNECLGYFELREIPFNLHNAALALMCVGTGTFCIESVFYKRPVKKDSKKKKAFYIAGKLTVYLIVIGFSALVEYGLNLSGYEKYFELKGAMLNSIAERFQIGFLLLTMIMGVFFIYFHKKRQFINFTYGKFLFKAFGNGCLIIAGYTILNVILIRVMKILDEKYFPNRDRVSLFYEEFKIVGVALPVLLFTFLLVQDKTGKIREKIEKVIYKYLLPVGSLCICFIVYYESIRCIWVREELNAAFYEFSYIFILAVVHIRLMAETYKSETVYSKIISYLPYVLVPLVLMQIYNLGIRIDSKGITMKYYVEVFLIIFETVLLIVINIRKIKKEICLLIFSGLVVITVFVPKINASAISKNCQFYILSKTYDRVLDGYEVTDKEYERMQAAYNYLSYIPEMEEVCRKYNIYSSDFEETLRTKENGNGTYIDFYAGHFVVENLFNQLDVTDYDTISSYKNEDTYVLQDNKLVLSLDLNNYKFVSETTDEVIYVDIEGFIEKCEELINYYGSYMGERFFSRELEEYYMIPIDDTHTFCIKEVDLCYKKGKKYSDSYFKWEHLNIIGFLLEKESKQQENIDLDIFDDENYRGYLEQLNEAQEKIAGMLPNVQLSEETLTDNIGIHSVCKGDIGNDGKNDIIIVLKYVETQEIHSFYPFDINDRVLCVYRENNTGTYDLKYVDYNLIMNKNYGGTYGDPFAGVRIEDGELVISHFGGSSDKWGYEYYFNWIEKELTLTKCIEKNSNSHTMNGIRTQYYYLLGRVEQYAFDLLGSTELLVYESRFEPERISIQNIKMRSEISDLPETYLVDMENEYWYFANSSYAENTIDEESLCYTAEKALDLIYETYYPKMVYTPIDISEYIFENREQALGYEQPRYYYSDVEGNVLYYYHMKFEEDTVYHKIRNIGDDFRYTIIEKENGDVEIEVEKK